MLLCEEYEFASFQKNVKVLTIMECLPTRKLDFLLATFICSRNLDHGVRNNYGRTKASKSLISHTKLSLNAVSQGDPCMCLFTLSATLDRPTVSQ